MKEIKATLDESALEEWKGFLSSRIQADDEHRKHLEGVVKRLRNEADEYELAGKALADRIESNRQAYQTLFGESVDQSSDRILAQLQAGIDVNCDPTAVQS